MALANNSTEENIIINLSLNHLANNNVYFQIQDQNSIELIPTLTNENHNKENL